MSRLKRLLLASIAALNLITVAADAQETTNYNYDALGRLIGSVIAGGPNDTRKTATCFDAAGNRTRYDVSTSNPAPCPTPSATPSP